MTESGRKADSVYLRAWDDYERYSLKLTATKTSGLGHAAFRTRSPQALQRRVTALQGSGYEIGWSDDELGHGAAYRCHNPDGHVIELYYETERYVTPPDLKPSVFPRAAPTFAVWTISTGWPSTSKPTASFSKTISAAVSPSRSF
jgi:catechol 2,3-dioxygenase